MKATRQQASAPGAVPDPIRAARQQLERDQPSTAIDAKHLPFVTFAIRTLGVPADRIPAIGVVKSFARDSILGRYVPEAHMIQVRGDLPEGLLHEALAHELQHARDAVQGKARLEETFERRAEAAAAFVRFRWTCHRYGSALRATPVGRTTPTPTGGWA